MRQAWPRHIQDGLLQDSSSSASRPGWPPGRGPRRSAPPRRRPSVGLRCSGCDGGPGPGAGAVGGVWSTDERARYRARYRSRQRWSGPGTGAVRGGAGPVPEPSEVERARCRSLRRCLEHGRAGPVPGPVPEPSEVERARYRSRQRWSGPGAGAVGGGAGPVPEPSEVSGARARRATRSPASEAPGASSNLKLPADRPETTPGPRPAEPASPGPGTMGGPVARPPAVIRRGPGRRAAVPPRRSGGGAGAGLCLGEARRAGRARGMRARVGCASCAHQSLARMQCTSGEAEARCRVLAS